MKGRLIGEGRTAEIWTYEDQKVMKLYRDGIPGEHITREYNISRYVQGKGLCAYGRERMDYRLDDRAGWEFGR